MDRGNLDANEAHLFFSKLGMFYNLVIFLMIMVILKEFIAQILKLCLKSLMGKSGSCLDFLCVLCGWIRMPSNQ